LAHSYGHSDPHVEFGKGHQSSQVIG